MGPERIDELLRESRARLDRLAAEDAHAAAHRGALLVDIRSECQREADGAVAGALSSLATCSSGGWIPPLAIRTRRWAGWTGTSS